MSLTFGTKRKNYEIFATVFCTLKCIEISLSHPFSAAGINGQNETFRCVR
jgi:hypothetical protein